MMDARNLMTFFVSMCFFVDYTMAGECCKAYYDLTFDYHDTKWCDDYCCGTSALGLLDCCSNALLIAPSDDRIGFCTDYFRQNIWAPIVIGLGGLGMFICCIVCCVGCCSGGKKGGTVVNQAPQQPATNVIMMTPGGQYGQQPQPVGHQPYGTYPGPAFPPQYQGVPAPGMPGPNPGIANANQPDTATKHPFEMNEPTN